AEAELTRHRDRKLDGFAVKRARRVVIRHELADGFAIRGDRNESERANSFRADGVLQVARKFGFVDIVDADRLRIALAGAPGRMTVHGLAVGFRQSAPGDEAHYAGFIEAQD